MSTLLMHRDLTIQVFKSLKEVLDVSCTIAPKGNIDPSSKLYYYMTRYLSKIEVITKGKYSVLPDEVLSISDMLVYYFGKTIITDGVTMLRIIFTDDIQRENNILGITYVYTPIVQWEKLISSQDINISREILLLEIVTVIERFITDGRWVDNGIRNIVQMMRERDCIFFEVYKKKSCKIDNIYKCGIQFRYKSLWSLELAFYNKDDSVAYVIPLIERTIAQSDTKNMLQFYASKLEIKNHTVNIYWRDKYFWSYNFNTNTLSLLSEKALSGDMHGTFELGKILYENKFVGRDIENAKKWLEKSVSQGNKRATILLQSIYKEGY